MTRLAIDARFAPGRMVGVGLRIVVGRELTHMAIIAGSIERIGVIPPIHRSPPLSSWEMAHAAGGRVEPFFFHDVIPNRKGLEPSCVEVGKEVENILAAKYMLDLVLFRTLAAILNYDAFTEVRTILLHPYDNIALMRREVFFCKTCRIGLHGQPVHGRGPELVKPFMALLATR